MSTPNPWEQALSQWQTTQDAVVQQWTQWMSGVVPKAPAACMPLSPMMGGMPHVFAQDPMAQLLQTVSGQNVALDQAQVMDIQKNYVAELTDLWRQGGQTPLPKDRRFADAAWVSNPISHYAAALYLLNAKTVTALAEAVQGDEKTKNRVRFAVQQWVDASAPSNFLALNAEAQKKALETQGESLTKGLQNLMHDLQQGHLSMTDESAFEVGKNVATSEGAVVYENPLFQLIEYKPLTEKVYERPFLMVPPCINKFYILDLQPDNSLIRYAVAQGHRTFVVSWRNPDESCAQMTWDNYIEDAVIQAMDEVLAITGAKDLNALGFCVGGTMLGTALAVLAARGRKVVNSATFLTTLLDFKDTGVLDVFIDENFVKFREMQFANGGLLPGRDLATTFSFLRPNDLVWNYVVSNYLKGDAPPPFDLLYWNSDSTNLPGHYYAWYLRNTYLENRLVQPGAATVCGEAIDLSKVTLPVYLYASREDHIVPLEGAYASTQVLPGPKRFVVGASGHIAGVINPASKNKRNYWVNDSDAFPAQAQDWMDGATDMPGSWWNDWSAWLAEQGGKQKAAPKSYGDRTHKAIEPAPGRYVKAKAA